MARVDNRLFVTNFCEILMKTATIRDLRYDFKKLEGWLV